MTNNQNHQTNEIVDETRRELTVLAETWPNRLEQKNLRDPEDEKA